MTDPKPAAAPAKTPEALGTEPAVAVEERPDEDARLAADEQDVAALQAQLEAARAELAAANERAAMFSAHAQLSDPSTATQSEYEVAAEGLPAEEGGLFRRADAFKPWRVIARNPNYTGETEGFGFSRGQSVIAPLPQAASEARVSLRMLRLNGLRNYDFHFRTRERGRNVTKVEPGYRVLTPDQWEAEYADRIDEGEELPEDL